MVEQQLKMYAANEAQYAQRRASAAAEKAAATAAATAAAAEAAAAAVTYENWKRCGVKLRYIGKLSIGLGRWLEETRAAPRVGGAPLLAARLAARPAAARLARVARRVSSTSQGSSTPPRRAPTVSPPPSGRRTPPSALRRPRVASRDMESFNDGSPSLRASLRDSSRSQKTSDRRPSVRFSQGHNGQPVSQRIEYEGSEPAAPTRPPNWAKGGGGGGAPRRRRRRRARWRRG